MNLKAIRARAEQRGLMGIGDLPMNTDILNMLDALDECIQLKTDLTKFGRHTDECIRDMHNEGR